MASSDLEKDSGMESEDKLNECACLHETLSDKDSVLENEADKLNECTCHLESKSRTSSNLSLISSSSKYELRPDMSLSEMKSKLSNIIKDKASDLVQACRNFDQRGTNKIQRTHLKQVLRKFCFPLTAIQFNLLLKELGMDYIGKINYISFFSKFTEGKEIIYDRKFERLESRNEDAPIEEIELQIKEKIEPRLKDVIHSFQLFDINNDGFIQKCELRRIIKNYCFDLNDTVFNELWKMYVPKDKGVINYKDFLIKLSINAERYRQYFPNNKISQDLYPSRKKSKDAANTMKSEQSIRQAVKQGKIDPAIQGLPVEEVIPIFLDKLHKNENLLKTTFPLFDYEKNGEVSFPDFCIVINFGVMALPSKLFDEICKKLDIDISSDSKIRYQDFLDKYATVNGKQPFQKKAMKLDIIPVVQKIKNNCSCSKACLLAIFTKGNEADSCEITRNELKRILSLDLKLKVSEDDFKALINLLDPENTNIINSRDFLKLFDDSNENTNDKICSRNINDSAQKEQHSVLKGEKLKSELKTYLNKYVKDVQKTMNLNDQSQSGFIALTKLRSIIEEFCFPLTEEQFEEIISDFKKCGDTLNYIEFLNSFKKHPSEDTDEWLATVNKLTNIKLTCSAELSIEEIEEMLRECILSRKTKMLKDFKILDICNVGVVCKDDARSVLNKFSFRFNDKQVNISFDY